MTYQVTQFWPGVLQKRDHSCRLHLYKSKDLRSQLLVQPAIGHIRCIACFAFKQFIWHVINKLDCIPWFAVTGHENLPCTHSLSEIEHYSKLKQPFTHATALSRVFQPSSWPMASCSHSSLTAHQTVQVSLTSTTLVGWCVSHQLRL